MIIISQYYHKHNEDRYKLVFSYPDKWWNPFQNEWARELRPLERESDLTTESYSGFWIKMVIE
jgi:hypothetical protein